MQGPTKCNFLNPLMNSISTLKAKVNSVKRVCGPSNILMSATPTNRVFCVFSGIKKGSLKRPFNNSSKLLKSFVGSKEKVSLNLSIFIAITTVNCVSIDALRIKIANGSFSCFLRICSPNYISEIFNCIVFF